MVYHGKVRKGVIVLDDGPLLPEGAIVTVEVCQSKEGGGNEDSLSQALLKVAGTCTGLPSDLAAQHDHYLHGTDKR